MSETHLEPINEDQRVSKNEPFFDSKYEQKRTRAKIVAAVFIAVLIAGGYLYYARAYLFIKGNPDNLINSYYQSIWDKDYEAAYDLLSEANKNMYTKDEFVLYFSLDRSYTQYKDYQVLKVNEYRNEVLDDNKFVRVIEYNVTEDLIMDDDSNNVKSALYKVYIVADSGRWRIYRLKEDINNSISNEYSSIGYMYETGKGKDKDIGIAEELFTKAISYDVNNPIPYFSLGFLYFQTDRIDNAIIMFQQYIDKDGDKQQKSDAYNMLAFCYINKNDKKTAFDCFQLALLLNPENQTIKQWMADLEK